MKADKPWQFLAACFEFKKLRAWQKLPSAYKEHDELYGYESHLECYIDGSNNGWQHLAAMSKDKQAGTLVSLVPTPIQKDLGKRWGGSDEPGAIQWRGLRQSRHPVSLRLGRNGSI